VSPAKKRGSDQLDLKQGAGQLSPQAQGFDSVARLRSELFDHQTIDLDDSKNANAVRFIRKIQAYDFGDDLSARLSSTGKSFGVSLNILADGEIG
jgi:hypothetical protein